MSVHRSELTAVNLSTQCNDLRNTDFTQWALSSHWVSQQTLISTITVWSIWELKNSNLQQSFIQKCRLQNHHSVLRDLLQMFTEDHSHWISSSLQQRQTLWRALLMRMIDHSEWRMMTYSEQKTQSFNFSLSLSQRRRIQILCLIRHSWMKTLNLKSICQMKKKKRLQQQRMRQLSLKS